MNSYGNLNNEEIFKGNGLGSGNAVIPLYINDIHWKQAKKHLPFVLGTILAHNPIAFNENHLNFVFSLLTEMTAKSFTCNSLLSVQWIKSYMSLLRTCSEIAYEKKYNKGIKKIVAEYIDKPEKLKKRPFGIDVMMGQFMCTGSNLDNDKFIKFVKCMYEDNVRKIIGKKYTYDYIDYLISIKNDKNYLQKEIDTFTSFLDNEMKYSNEHILSFVHMNRIMEELKKDLGGFKSLLKLLDDNYGSLPDTIAESTLNKIQNQKITNSSYSNIYDCVGICKEDMKAKLMHTILQIISGKKKDDYNSGLTIEEILDNYENKN